MFKIVKNDKEWCHAIIHNNGQNYLMSPPFLSGKKITLNEMVPENAPAFKTPQEIHVNLMTIFAINNLDSVMLLLKKYNASGLGNFDLEKIYDHAIKLINNELRNNSFPEKEMQEVFSLHVGLGIGLAKRKKLLRVLKSYKDVSPSKIEAFESKINRDPVSYEHMKDEILSAVEYIMNKISDPEKAYRILVSIKTHLDIAPGEHMDRIETLLATSKHLLIKRAKESGESMAKPWQKYINPEPAHIKREKILRLNESFKNKNNI